MNSEKRSLRHPSNTGHILDPERPVVSYALDIAHEASAPHTHPRAQLLYSVKGVMRVNTRAGTWLLPPTQAVWIPSMVEHQVEAGEAIAMRSVYVDPAWSDGLPTSCQVIRVSPLLRELILRAVEVGNDYPPEGPVRRLMEVIVDELQGMQRSPLHLPLSQHPQVRAIQDALVGRPDAWGSLDSWAAQVGTSSRTLSRLFVRETGMAFGAWRRRLHLLEAIDRLERGEPVTRVALELGYQSLSAFSAMFRSELGVSPRSYGQR